MLTQGLKALPNNGFVIIRPFNTGATESLLTGEGVGKGFTCKGKSSKRMYLEHAINGTLF